MGEVTNILGKVEQRLERLNAMTNNAVVDQVLDSAKAELDQLVKVQVPKMVAGVSNALKVNQRGLETARTNAGDTTKPAEYIEKWSRLRDRWQRVLRSLDLQSDEVRGIHADLVKLARTLDEEREYLRELIKVGEAEALSEDLASFIKALASLRDRVAQTLGPAPQKEPGPRPQISSN
jgi:cell division septum initiation protein DivIVA